jgi:hypothetical protein
MSLLDPTIPANKAHRTRTLNSRKVVDYLRANPNASSSEIWTATGFSVMRLQKLGVVKGKKRADGKMGWCLSGDLARPWVEKGNES